MQVAAGSVSQFLLGKAEYIIQYLLDLFQGKVEFSTLPVSIYDLEPTYRPSHWLS